jgi:hypothetical protein
LLGEIFYSSNSFTAEILVMFSQKVDSAIGKVGELSQKIEEE